MAVLKHATLYGSWGWQGDDFRKAIQMVQMGLVQRKGLISHEYPLEEVVQAFEIQDRPDLSIKVILKPR